MSRRRAVLIVLVGCCLLLGGKTIESAAPAVASSTATSRTAPRDLTKHFPLGPQRLCCQSTSQSHTSAAPPSSGATPRPAQAPAGPRAALTTHPRRSRSWSSGSSVGAAVAGLLAAGVANLRRAHRESPQALPPGVAAADCPERARAAADPVSRAQHGAPRRR